MLQPGDPVPDATVWTHEHRLQLRDVVAGDGHSLVCFYPFDWSPG